MDGVNIQRKTLSLKSGISTLFKLLNNSFGRGAYLHY